jgi:hypothetical protein
MQSLGKEKKPPCHHLYFYLLLRPRKAERSHKKIATTKNKKI